MVDGDIQKHKSEVHFWEEEELKQLELKVKEKGLFCVKWCLVVSVSTVNCELRVHC